MPIALKQQNGFNSRPVPYVCWLTSVFLLLLPNWKTWYVSFLFLPFSLISEKGLKSTWCFLPLASVNGISFYIQILKLVGSVGVWDPGKGLFNGYFILDCVSSHWYFNRGMTATQGRLRLRKKELLALTDPLKLCYSLWIVP